MGCHMIDLPFMALDLKYPLTVEAKSEKITHKESAPKWLISKRTFGARGSLPPMELTWYDGNKRPPLQKEHNMPDWPEATIFVGSKGMMNMAPAPIRLQKHIVVHGDNLGKENPCHIVVDEAISWLDENRNPDKPFFQNIWFHEPHAPIAAPDEIVSRYGKRNDPAAIYSGTIDNTDRAITRLLAKLEQIDSPENTLIVYSSDNGSYRADRVGNLRSKKGPNFEGGIRVPGIFS